MAVRRVRRIVRRIDPWTVLKVSLVFNAVGALVFVLGTWVTWSMALRRGIPDRVVDIFESLTLTLTIDGELYFRMVVLLAIIGAILMTTFMTLGAVLYNLIADLVGGVEIAVLEETYKPASSRIRLKPIDEGAPVAEPWPGESVAETPSAPKWSSPAPDIPEVIVPAAAVLDSSTLPTSEADSDSSDEAAAPSMTEESDASDGADKAAVTLEAPREA